MRTLALDLPESVDLLLLHEARALHPDILSLVESRLRPGAFVIADDANESPDHPARCRGGGYLSSRVGDDVELSVWLS